MLAERPDSGRSDCASIHVALYSPDRRDANLKALGVLEALAEDAHDLGQVLLKGDVGLGGVGQGIKDGEEDEDGNLAVDCVCGLRRLEEEGEELGPGALGQLYVCNVGDDPRDGIADEDAVGERGRTSVRIESAAAQGDSLTVLVRTGNSRLLAEDTLEDLGLDAGPDLLRLLLPCCAILFCDLLAELYCC